MLSKNCAKLIKIWCKSKNPHRTRAPDISRWMNRTWSTLLDAKANRINLFFSRKKNYIDNLCFVKFINYSIFSKLRLDYHNTNYRSFFCQAMRVRGKCVLLAYKYFKICMQICIDREKISLSRRYLHMYLLVNIYYNAELIELPELAQFECYIWKLIYQASCLEIFDRRFFIDHNISNYATYSTYILYTERNCMYEKKNLCWENFEGDHSRN